MARKGDLGQEPSHSTEPHALWSKVEVPRIPRKCLQLGAAFPCGQSQQERQLHGQVRPV